MKNKIRRRPKFRFPDSKGDYWFLNWVGYTKRNTDHFTIDLYFVNTSTPSDRVGNFLLESQVIINKPSSVLYHFTIGCIFNRAGKLILHPKEYAKKYTAILKLAPNFLPTKKQLPFGKGCHFPIPEDKKNFVYYKIYQKNQFGPSIVILPIHTICNFLYFGSSELIKILMEDRLSEIVDLNSKKQGNDEDGWKGLLYYDNLKISKEEIKKLAPLLFIKNGLGVVALRKIGSLLLKGLLKEKSKFKSYIDTTLPFHGCELTLHGKYINYNGSKYFIVYEINNITINKKENYVVDSIEIKPKFPNESTEDRNNHVPKKGDKKRGENVDIELIISSENPIGDSFNPIENIKTDENIFDSDIPIEFETRLDQDETYDVNTSVIPTHMEEITLELEKIEKESKALRSKLIKEKLVFNRFEYLHLLCEILDKEYGVSKSFVEFANYIDQKRTSYFLYNGKSYELIVVKIKHEARVFYLVEFQKGLTGIIHDIHHNDIDLVRLDLLIREVVKDEMEWSLIFRQSKRYLRKYGIQIIQPVRHQVKNMKDYDAITFHAAEKIYSKIATQ